MMSRVKHFVVEQNSTFKSLVKLYDIDKLPFDLEGYIPICRMRHSIYTDAIMSFTCSIVLPTASGKMFLSLTSAQTKTLKPGKYEYDLVLINGAGERFRALSGIVTVDSGVSY